MWWVPILAAIASGVATSGMNSLLAEKPKQPEQKLGQLGSVQSANAKMNQPMIDPMQEDVLSQYVARLSQNRMA